MSHVHHPRIAIMAAGAFLLSAACSSGAVDSATGAGGSGENLGGGGGTGGEGRSGGTSSGGGSGGAGAGGLGGSDGGMGGTTEQDPPEPCSSVIALEAGSTYGGYTLFAIRRDAQAEPGDYSMRASEDEEGTAYVYRQDQLIGGFEYDAAASLEDNALQTIAFESLFELDVRSQSEPDLGALPESLFDGCHVVSIAEPESIAEGDVFGSFQLTELSLDPDAPSGTYTFYAASGNDGVVELRLDGATVDTLSYDWMTTVGGGESYTFVFQGVASLTITRLTGTSNLFGLADTLFDGLHLLTVP